MLVPTLAFLTPLHIKLEPNMMKHIFKEDLQLITGELVNLIFFTSYKQINASTVLTGINLVNKWLLLSQM
jgi:hypothetical protein